MTQEEKAKAYDKAKINGSRLWECGEITRENYEYMFPEIEENEDDKIRKTLIHIVKGACDKYGIKYQGKEINEEKLLDWLEKIGEHLKFCETIQIGDRVTRNEGGVLVNMSQLDRIAKPRKIQSDLLSCDKVEPKFKKGDWIITNKKHIWYVDETPETTSYLYRLINQYGKVEVAEFEVVDEKARLWSIEDAKDGDILTDKQNCTCIFREIMTDDEEETSVDTYCGINIDNEFVANKKGEVWTVPEDLFPATKEQRDQLEKVMADAGYTFDAEKKQLKRIEQKPADETKVKIEEGKWYVCISQFGNCIEGRVYKATSYSRIMDDFGTEYDIHSDAYKYFRLWTAQDAKDGDVLVSRSPFIYGKQCPYGGLNWYNNNFIKASNFIFTDSPVHPATKEQRNLLFQKMHEKGYEWDAEKLQLKKIEEEYNGEDYGIDGLYAAIDILQKTLGKVDGYQSDDGILEHKCAISAVKELSKQKPAEWSEEDEEIVEALNDYVKNLDLFFSEIKIGGKNIISKEFREKVQHWLKSPKSQNH